MTVLALPGALPLVAATPGREAPGQPTIGPEGCELSTLHGPYALHGSGQLLAGPFGVVGRVEFSGDGRVSGHLSETSATLGSVERTTLEGTYALAASCQGELTVTVQHELWTDHHSLDFYVAAGGDKLFWILTGTWFGHLGADHTEITVDLGLGGLTETVMSDLTAHRYGGMATGVAERI